MAAVLITFTQSPLDAESQTLYLPVLQSSAAANLGLALVNPSLTEAQVTLTARTYNGTIIQGYGVTNPVKLTLPASTQLALTAAEIFGSGIKGLTGWVELSASSSAVKGIFALFDARLTFIDAAELIATPANRLIFPKVSGIPSSQTRLTLVNTSPQAVAGNISLYENSGKSVGRWDVQVPGFSGLALTDVVPLAAGFEGYAVVESGAGADSGKPAVLIGFETYRNRSDIALVRGFPETARLRTGYVPQLASQGGYSTSLTLVNFSSQTQVLRITAEGLEVAGNARVPSSVTVERTLLPNARLEERVDQMFNLTGDSLIAGYIRLETEGDTSGVFGFLEYGSTDGVVLAAVEAQGEGYSDLFFSQVAEGNGYYTGLAMLNPGSGPSIVTLDMFDHSGSHAGSVIVNLKPGERTARLLDEFFQRPIQQLGGYVRITATRPIFAFQLFGSSDSFTFLANVSAQGVRLTPQTNGRMVDASKGANVISADGSASILIPPGALTANAPINVAAVNVAGFPRPTPGSLPVSSVEATPSGTQLQIPVHLNFPLNVQMTPGVRTPLWTYNSLTQQYTPTQFVAIVDGSGRVASAEVTHFTTFVVALPEDNLLPVLSLSPSQGGPGTVVTINGGGFSANPADNIVTFAGPNNTSIPAILTMATATSLQVTVPNGAVTGPVVVQVASRSSTGVTFTALASNPIPSDVSLSPSKISASMSPAQIQISGTGFQTNLVVNYDAVSTPYSFVDSTLLMISLQGPQLTQGLHRIQVVNPPPGGGASNVLEITVAPANQPPIVNAGSNQTITLPASTSLNGTATENGLPAGTTLTTTWSKVSGPGIVTFGNVNALSTTASFSLAGTYVLRLTATDGVLTGSAYITITVNEQGTPPPPPPPLTVSITSPTSGSSVTGTITISATASNNVVGVQFQLDGTSLGAEVTASPYSVSWNTRTASNGLHVLTAVARDAAGNPATSSPVTVIVSNSTPPTVSITSPINGSPVSATIPVLATASSNTVGVQFQLDGANLGAEVTASPYSVSWNTTTASNGSHTLTAVARDAAGNRTTSSAVTVTVANGGNPPVVDAGPPKVIAFPAKDLTLFGHARDPNNDPLTLTVLWTLTNGPAPVSFSAPAALTTTVSFTMPGTYIFQLAASNGASTGTGSTTVTVNSTSSQTAFYVDPMFTSTGNGTAASPWSVFQDGNPNQNAQWNAINSALATNDVVIYFSARQAGSDTAEEIVGSIGPGSVIRVRRTDTSSHRLTLDGMSKYNTNDSNPSWADYTGSSKMRLRMTGGCCISIGWDDDVQRDYITIRGFEVTGSGARIRWGGSYSVLENMWVHDVTGLGATVQFNQAVADESCRLLGIDHDITVRNNVIQRGIGEGIYIAGNYNYATDGGCQTGPNGGDNHYDILIENNTETDTGLNGDQGDGIDLKAGLYNVTVRGNNISLTHAGGAGCTGGDGIVTLGQMNLSTHDSNYLIENNVFHDLGCRNGSDSSNGMALAGLHSAIVRNNIVYNIPGSGIVAWTRTTGSTPNAQRIRIYNNTVYAAGAGLAFTDFDDAPVVRNNLLLNNSVSIGGDPPGIDSDYNLLSPTGSQLSEGSHSIVRSSTTRIVANPAGADFHLILGSPAIGKGVELSPTGFSTDISGNPRPKGAAWDIGAYEFKP